MEADRMARAMLAVACVAAPAAGVTAAVAAPALSTSHATEIVQISQHPDRDYVYALFILLSSYLLVPAVFGVGRLFRTDRPRWAVLSVAVAQTGLLIAIGDAAVELMYWQMGRLGGDHVQMTALSDRYESAAGVSLVYSIGGLLTLVGVVSLSIGLWRTRALPR